MITCKECRASLWDDPRIPVGRYNQSSCDFYCIKSAQDRELGALLEAPQSTERVVVYRHSNMGRDEYRLLQGLAKRVSRLEKRGETYVIE